MNNTMGVCLNCSKFEDLKTNNLPIGYGFCKLWEEKTHAVSKCDKYEFKDIHKQVREVFEEPIAQLEKSSYIPNKLKRFDLVSQFVMCQNVVKIYDNELNRFLENNEIHEILEAGVVILKQKVTPKEYQDDNPPTSCIEESY